MEGAAQRLDPVGEPAQAGTGLEARAAPTVIADGNRKHAIARYDLDRRA